jgi:hypothetical protein
MYTSTGSACADIHNDYRDELLDLQGDPGWTSVSRGYSATGRRTFNRNTTYQLTYNGQVWNVDTPAHLSFDSEGTIVPSGQTCKICSKETKAFAKIPDDGIEA